MRRNTPICTAFVAFFLCFTLQTAYPQSRWEKLKEKASEAWNSDTRKEAWEKTKEVSKKAWNSDTRKNAWSKTKEVTKKATHAVSESQMMEQFEYTVPVVNRSFYNFVPDKYLVPYSTQQYQAFVRGSKACSNASQKAQVQRVSKRLIAATERLLRNNGMSNELRNFSWEVNAVKSSEINAFCMPGGKIVVYTGILPVAGDDASLACVIGHEIAHAVAKHSAEQMSKKVMTTVGVAALYAILTSRDMSNSQRTMAQILAASGITLANLKFSRMNETEADRLGLIIAAMAGYNPEVAVKFWQRMGDKSSLKTSRDWFSTHPSNTNRIANMKKFIPEAKRYMGR